MQNPETQERRYIITARYLDAGVGWRTNDTPILGTFQDAGETASRIAKALDAEYGGSHFWTVDLFGIGEDGNKDGLGSYYQLFHGRLS